MTVEVVEQSQTGRSRRRGESESEDSEDDISQTRIGNRASKQVRRDIWTTMNNDMSNEEEDDVQEEESEQEESEQEESEEEESVQDKSVQDESVLDKSVQNKSVLDKSEKRERDERKNEDYPVGSYIVAVYQGKWYVGQVLDKKKEKNALPQDHYVFISFMQRPEGSGDQDVFKWPNKPDKLNTLKEDVLFACRDPTPSNATSSSRSISYSLSKVETKKAYMLLNKAYYHTITLNTLSWLQWWISLYVRMCCLEVVFL
jgi:FKBP-type peptidyl-prolyl cis-trans isomerase